MQNVRQNAIADELVCKPIFSPPNWTKKYNESSINYRRNKSASIQ